MCDRSCEHERSEYDQTFAVIIDHPPGTGLKGFGRR